MGFNMKAYRVTWHAVIENGSVLQGRSLIYAESKEEAVEKLVSEKSKEYRLKPYWVQIRDIIEFSGLETG